MYVFYVFLYSASPFPLGWAAVVLVQHPRHVRTPRTAVTGTYTGGNGQNSRLFVHSFHCYD